ncbi:MAG: AAA domain-containing protein [Myxococcota bacterium]
MTTSKNLAPAIRASLNAKLERLLERPIIGRIVDAAPPEEDDAEDDELPDVFRVLQGAARAFAPTASARRRARAWTEDPDDGTCCVRIWLDYDDLWRGYEKEILETVSGTVESNITFLTDQQRLLLERSPREFLALDPRPESAELVAFETEKVGGSVRVVALKFAAAPESRAHIRHVAVVPNLVQIERQLAGLRAIENAAEDGPLAPLRVLLGLSAASCLPTPPPADVDAVIDGPAPDERLDEYQTECIRKAMTTPHFAVIQGPPGSGKTTVITGIIRHALGRGEHVLVVSPTHVAVDNVVEKLAPRQGDGRDDALEARSLPVRYSARKKKLSERALEYWVGSKKQRRGATIARRIQQRLIKTIPFAEALFAIEDKEESGHAPLSSAVAGVEAVICGTPIGILSFETVKNAAAGSFGLLIVD